GEITLVPALRRGPPELVEVTIAGAVDDVLAAFRIEHVGRRVSRSGRRAGHRGQVAAAPAVGGVPPQLVDVAVAGPVHHVLRALGVEDVGRRVPGRGWRAGHRGQVAVVPA